MDSDSLLCSLCKVKGFFWNNNIILLNNCNKTPKKATQGPHLDVFWHGFNLYDFLNLPEGQWL